MPEAGLYALTKIVAGGLSAVVTGPLGSADLPDIDLAAEIAGNAAGYSAEVRDASGEKLGYAGLGSGYSPSPLQLPDRFIQALLSVEDARFGSHPGVDPAAVAAAAIDTATGTRRGGSTLTQQVVKNAITGPDLTVDRKIREAILAVRAQSDMAPTRIIQGYLANAWFGRGQNGAAGAALAWFGKDWADIQLHEAAFLAGILKGPSYYDPIDHPERAMARRNVVLTLMHERGMITGEDLAVATSLPLEVISPEESDRILDALPRWIASGIDDDFRRYGLMNRSDIAEGDLEITATLSGDWQAVAEEALRAGVDRIGTPGPARRIALSGLAEGADLSGDLAETIRAEAAEALSTTRKSGRAIVTSVSGDMARIIVDRGYGDLEWDETDLSKAELGFTPARGDVLPYVREDDRPVLRAAPQVQGAVVVMNPWTGAVLASVGGTDPDLFPFDRTQALRQPGSALKPFLWTRAMDEGIRWSDMVEDRERSYVTPTGETWRPRNYDGSQAGLIPLFVALEESSNLVAASLVSQLGVESLAQITEIAGVYDWGGMRRHPSSALGASETTLTRLAAGYAALANGGRAVTPHHVASVRREGRQIWTPRGAEENYGIASRGSIGNVTSMLYGVTHRGTAYNAMKGLDVPVAGKTGTTQDYKDAWFMSFTPGVVVGVWIGRDDADPIPGDLSGSRAAAPIARDIYEAALARGLLTPDGFRPNQENRVAWPPELLDVQRRVASPTTAVREQAPRDTTDPFKRPVPGEPRASRPVEGLDRILEQGRTARSDAPEPRGGYLDDTRDPGGIYSSSPRETAPRSPDNNLIFRTPW